ncbi:MAG: ABC transporter permease, partial [Candidatus Neomarinimicrobiota bacterium]
MNLTNVKLVLRRLFTHRVFSIINISGLALGMATCILIFLWVQDELGYDRFHQNADTLHRVVENQHYAGGEIFPVAVTPGPLAFTLKDDYPEIVNACRIQRPMTMLVEYEDQSFNEAGVMLASPTFFEMFTFPFLQGDPATALDDLNSIVVTRSMAEKYFGDRDPLGQRLRLFGQSDFTVTGVIEDIPPNSHLQFSMVSPFMNIAQFGANLDDWGSNSYFTYVQLQEGTPHQEVSAKIIDVIKEHNEGSVTDLYLQPLPRIHLHSDFTADIGGHGEFQYVVLFSIIALIILAIACINFMNLSTARSANRAKEVGMRKVVGAQRRQIALQFIGESMIMVIISFGIAILLVELLLPTFNHLAAKQLAIMQLDSGQVIILAGAVLLTGLVAGSYPAMFLSSFQPVKVLRGVLGAGARSSTMRKILVIGQFALATGLIIGAVIVHRQLNYIQNKKLGYDQDNLVYFRMGRAAQPNYEALKLELEQNPGILAVSRASSRPTYIGSSSSGFEWEGKNPDDVILIHFTSVGYDFDKTLGLEMATGRFYSQEFPADAAGAVVVNEEAIRVMGLEDPLGKQLTGFGEEKSIIGVVKDFHFKSVHN